MTIIVAPIDPATLARALEAFRHLREAFATLARELAEILPQRAETATPVPRTTRQNTVRELGKPWLRDARREILARRRRSHR